jgi:molybdopterin-guanine dinucleotide biosynthesis protein B
LSPVDIVILEAFRNAALPTVEVWLPSSGRPPRWWQNPHVFAIVSDAAVDTSIARFKPGDVAELAGYVAKHLGIAH